MSTKTGISWTDATWNPIRGCSRVSEGCRHCYAERVAYRFSGEGLPYEGLVRIGADGERKPEWNGQIKFVEEHLLDPLRWKKPRRIFVNSMSDLFHENVTDEMRDVIFGVMSHCPHHTFQILTKRPERMLAYLTTEDRVTDVYDSMVDSKLIKETRANDVLICRGQDRILIPDEKYGLTFDWKWPLPNVHLGVSVEDQKTADLRIPLLLQTPAAVRFISAEPLLEPLDLNLLPRSDEFHRSPYGWMSWLAKRLHWVIVGGESGPGARPMHPDWARSLRDQCKAAGVPFFFKQWGEWGDWDGTEENDHQAAAVASIVNDERKWPTHLHNFGEDTENGDWTYRIGTKAAGCLLDGVEHHEFPAVRA